MILLSGKSLSKLGKGLDGLKYYHKEDKPSATRKNLQKRIHRQFNKINKAQQIINPTFNTVSRDVKSPFTMRHTKDTGDNKYSPQYNTLKAHTFQCKISETQTKHLFDDRRNYETTSSCGRHSGSLEVSKRRRQKSLHHLDFDKQSPRKMNNQLKDSELDPELRFNNFQSSILDNKGRPFSSYTKRSELFSKAIHPLMINLRDCKTHLFRKGWSPQRIVPFDKLKDKIMMRSDKKFQQRVSEFSSKSSDLLKSGRLTQRSTFMSQTERKPNLVKSQYHFRICL